MARGKNSNGGYQPAIKLNVTLPDKIRCIVCKKLKGAVCYASNRLEDLKKKIAENKNYGLPSSEVISCTKCTGSNMVEMECNECDTVYGLDKFSKAQRKNPDEAICWDCMQNRQNDSDGSSSSGGGDDDTGSEGSIDDDAATTIGGTFSNLSISGADSSAGGVALNSTSGSVFNFSANGAHGRTALNTTASTISSSTTTTNAADAFIPLHRRSKAPSSIASTSTAAPRVDNSGWAKVGARTRKMDTAAARRVREERAAREKHAGEGPDDDLEVATSESDTD